MIIFTILTLMVIGMIIAGITILATGGVVGAVIFGDIIVCAALIGLVIKAIIGKKK